MKKTASATHSTGKICILRILRKKLCKKIYSINTGNTKIGNINIGDNSSFQQNVYCSEKACSQVLRQGTPGIARQELLD